MRFWNYSGGRLSMLAFQGGIPVEREILLIYRDWAARLQYATVLLFFFLSGACALLYQVVWTRQLILMIGTTSYAVSSVLAVFFMGLALGSLGGGHVANRTRRPLRLYALCEVIIGLWAWVLILGLFWGESLVVSILREFAFSRGFGIALRALVATVSLIVPVTLMGATLPLMTNFVARDRHLRGFRIGMLYSVNTLGALVGCVLTGFVLVENLGYSRTITLGALVNLAIGALAFLLSRRTEKGAPAPAPADAESKTEDPALPGSPSTVRLVTAGFAVMGFCGLALEVLWTRLLGIVFIGTTYAFTTMLASVLLGIAVGSAVAAPLVDKRRHPVLLFGLLQVLAGAACIATLRVFEWLPDQFEAMRLDAGFQWVRLVSVKFLLSGAVVFVPMFLSGACFPLVARAVTRGQARAGRRVGLVYAANTVGGVVGTLAAGYVLIPWLGTHNSILALGICLFAAGVALVATCWDCRRVTRVAAIVLSIMLVAGALMSAPSDIARRLNEWYVPQDDRVLLSREGVEGTVVVSEPKAARAGSDRVLWINGVQATASIERGVRMNRFESAVSMVYDRDPKSVLFMCLGSGVTLGTLALYDVDHIDGVEISRDVLEVVDFFKADNFGVRHNPKIDFHIDDGRNFLLTSNSRYDLITFEPMPLALAGVSTFYTEEYYRLCFDHLAPGGFVSQWVPLHSLEPQVVKSLVYTFTQVFPHACAWLVNADLFVIGSNRPIVIDYAAAARRMARPEVAAALREVNLEDPVELVTHFVMGEEALKRYTQGSQKMTDDRPWIEFVAPRIMYQRNEGTSLAELQSYYESPLPLVRYTGMDQARAERAALALDRRHRSKVESFKGLVAYYGSPVTAEPEAFFKKALDIDPLNGEARFYLAEVVRVRAAIHIVWQEPEEAIRVLTDALRYLPDNAALHLTLADIYYERGDAPLALQQYAEYFKDGGRDPKALERQAALQQRAR